MNILQLAQQLYSKGKQALNTSGQRFSDLNRRAMMGDPAANLEFVNAATVPLTMGVGKVAPFVKSIAKKSAPYVFEDLDTAIGIIRSKSASANDYIRAAKTIMSEARMQMTPQEFIKYQKKPLERVISKILPRVKNEEAGIENALTTIKRIKI